MTSDLNKRGIKDEIEGGAKEVEGKVRTAVGNVTGNKSEQQKGAEKELEGKVQKAVGKVERDVADQD
jgi:uncharacterized protein YjbJ (UPF0337 family)